LSLFSPKILETVNSKYSGEVKVVSTWGYKYIATGVLTQSGGLVRDVWEPVLRQVAKKSFPWAESGLILGLAGGTIAGIVAGLYPGIHITGVEIDPEMIRLGRKYLGMDKIPNLDIEIKDAKDYVFHIPLHSHFDLILVDMYIGDQLPSFVYSPKFLKKLSQSGRLVIFNHLYYDDCKRRLAGQLVDRLGQIFGEVRLMRKLTNLLIICEADGIRKPG